MRLDVVLGKIGAEIVKVEKHQGRVTIFLRTGRKRADAARWKQVVEEMLLAASEQRKVTWGVDISKAFFADRGAVKYLWRVVLTGDVKQAAENFGNATMRSLSQGAEVTSMPLIGQVQYEWDPANGKMKGGHSQGKARTAITQGISGGNIQ
jgi:hypothetical protein